MITLQSVIQKLTEIEKEEGNLEVCKVGHYGEINEMHFLDIQVRKARKGAFGDGKEKKIVNLDTPSIGPGPD